MKTGREQGGSRKRADGCLHGLALAKAFRLSLRDTGKCRASGLSENPVQYRTRGVTLFGLGLGPRLTSIGQIRWLGAVYTAIVERCNGCGEGQPLASKCGQGVVPPAGLQPQSSAQGA